MPQEPAHYALLEYSRDMHQYTLELWMELSKKLEAGENCSLPQSDVSPTTPSEKERPRSGGASNTRNEAESPNDE